MALTKEKKSRKPQRGRPKVADLKMNFTLRADRVLMSELDAWAKVNGDMGRAAAIRMAIMRLLRS